MLLQKILENNAPSLSVSLALNGQDGNGWQLDKLGQLFQVDKKLITENNLLCLSVQVQEAKEADSLIRPHDNQ